MDARRFTLATAAVAGALTLAGAARAADPEYAAGFAGGLTYGLGLAGRVQGPEWGVQASFLPYYTGDSGLFAGGVTAFRTINQGSVGRLYASFGSAAVARIASVTDAPPCDASGVCGPVPAPRRETSGGFAVGPGLGMEFRFGGNFALSVELPVAFAFDATKGVSLRSILPIPNAALLYTF
jgi:hypothetical protein